MHARVSAGRLVTAIVAVLAVAIGILATPPAVRSVSAETIGTKPSVPGRPLHAVAAEADPEASPPPRRPAPQWPTAGAAEVAVPAETNKATNASWARAGGLPVFVGPTTADTGKAAAAKAVPPSRVRVEVAGQDVARRLGAAGLVVRVHRRDGGAQAGPVAVALDYSGFRYAYGGNYADRLHLYEFPACALTTPDVPACTQRTPARSSNDVRSGRVTARVDAAPETAAGAADTASVFALVPTASGNQTGDYRATDVRASGKWEAGQASGAFGYSYPLVLPPSPYGQAPELGLSYDSQSVDGRSSAENSQASWVGMGWDLQAGFIERKYKPCADDAGSGQDALKTWGDLCWDSPVAGKDDGAVYVISLGGHTTELIWDSATSRYRMKDDQDWKIDHHTSGGHGADDEYWVITAPDGTRSYLGYGADPTKTTANATNSVWTVPVIGDDAGEPCHNSSTPASMTPCTQAYRWNLDRVIDPDGTESAYYYTAESNAYKRHQGGAVQSYIRGGYLEHIEYGLREDQPAGTPAPDKVRFASFNRCVERNAVDDPYDDPPATCPTVASGGSDSYPDVPVDLVCTTSCSSESPSFFVVHQLAQVVTQARKIDGSAGYDDVNTYQLKYAYPGTGDTTSPSLWLDYVRAIGHMGDGGDIKAPVVDFNGTNYNNIATPGAASVNMRRITTIQNDLGGDTHITYGLPNPCNTSLSDWSGTHNTADCFRSYYTPTGGTAQWGIFNKYIVTQVTDTDRVGGNPDQSTSYTYSGADGWRFDDDLSRSTDHQSWSDWRGYKTVTATAGSSSDPAKRGVTSTTFFRGLNNDRTTTGGSGALRHETVTDFDGHVYDDDHFLNGRTLQTRTWTDTSASVDVASTRYTYYHSAMTADGPGFHNAVIVRPDGTHTRARKRDGSYRVTATDSSFDAHGRPTQTLAEGDPGDSGDDRCTTTTYADNTAGGMWMLSYPETVTLHSGSCTGAIASKSVSLYDGASAPGAANAPTAGNATQVRVYRDADTYTLMNKTYDAFGRPTSMTAANGTAATDDDTSTISYRPATGWPADGVTTVNPLGHTTVSYSDRRDGALTKTVDANQNVTALDYDTLGRLIRVWGPTEPRPADPDEGTPTERFTYVTPYQGIGAPSGPTIVRSQQYEGGDASDPNWISSYAYLDGFGRTNEVQTTAPWGPETGRMVAVTRYDDRGQVAGQTGVPVYNSAAAGNGVLNPDQGVIPSWTSHTYDSAGRETESALWSVGTKKWSALTDPAADTTVVTPPSGGKTASTVDVFGQTTAITQDSDGDAEATTRYAYTVRGELAQITDADGNVATNGYDWAGQRKTSHDPDAGDATYTYDPAGNVSSTTDAAGTISYTYDALNRRRVQYSGQPTTGTRLAQWDFDPPGALGQPSAAIRYTGGQAYRSDVLGYDARYRPKGTRVTIPSTQGALAGNYDTTYTYDPADHLTSVTYPAAGGLPAEKVSTRYSGITGTPLALTSDLGSGYTYVKRNYYWSTGELAQRDYGSAGDIARAYTYEDPTDRLTRVRTIMGNAGDSPSDAQNDTYAYDKAGDVTSITDTLATVGEDEIPQRQCFTYDGISRLTGAWTTTGAPGCTAGAAGADTGGPDPYQLAYSYTDSGNIKTVADNGVTIGYNYPTAGPNAVRPHAVTSITHPTGTDNYTHDASGQLSARTVAGKNTTLDWNELHQLTTATTGGSSTGFVYDAGGERLIRSDPGATTLYLGGMELRAAGGSVTATRYYSLGGATVALRHTGDPAATWLTADTQGSAQLSIQGWTGTIARQRYLPFGAHRGDRDDITATQRGFLGQTEDPTTGLDDLGARYYDPTTGAFISPDPLQAPGEPQQLNPYAYAANNPTTASDPSGLMPDGPFITQTGHVAGGARSNGGSGLPDSVATPCSSGYCLYHPRSWDDVPGAYVPGVNVPRAIHATSGAFGWMPGIGDVADVADAITYAIDGKYADAAISAAGVFPLGEIPKTIRNLRRGLKVAEEAGEAGRAGERAGRAAEDGGEAADAAPRPKAKPKDEPVPKTPRRRSAANHGCSLVPGTQVLMADGSTKAIENVKVGDKVLSTDPETGKTQGRPVLATITGTGTKHLVQITVTTHHHKSKKSGVVIATDNHPFWTERPGQWTQAGELKPGMWLRASAGTHVQITAIKTWTQHQTVHNLTVNGVHTYYVKAGVTSVLVHNCYETLDFAHGTTSTHADNIQENGLSGGAAQANSRGGSVGQPGNLFTYAVTEDDTEILSATASFGATRAGAGERPALLIFQMGRSDYDRLTAAGHITTRVTDEVSGRLEHIFSPGAMPYLNLIHRMDF
ncbi:polymorphic toxin-type HINT domain-containing protein [Actinomadura sp. DC4]|uniref:polymorphic toxin-type HINT domain-containing protein n=1 Tax=Actinomadura sp. DC4 TaxID=3055069 RepID=UPI0025B0A27B|nr:polymorphic toxin-type HINT domain-containing protein [Actinomadura sp. DC4]MDN3357330.1 polymorphic toxin-type HINT domain-containing protein [Actinomadura sp. DC4]